MFSPVTDEERPHLEAMGSELRVLRIEREMTLKRLGERSQLTAQHLSRLEKGQRRPRRSTLQRIVGALVDADRVEELVADLVDLAGPGLAPESDYAERVARRRERRTRRELDDVESARRVLAQTIAQAERSGIPQLVTMVPRLKIELAGLDQRSADLREAGATGGQP